MINEKLQEVLETLRESPNLVNSVAPMTYGEIAEAFLALEKHAEKGWTWAGKLADDRTEQEVRAEKAEAALEEEKDLHDDTIQAMHLWCERAKKAETQLLETERQEPVVEVSVDGMAMDDYTFTINKSLPDGVHELFIHPIAIKKELKTCDACIDVLSALGFHYKTAKLKDVLAEVKRLRVTATINLAELLEVSANKTADQIYHLFDGIYDDRGRAWSLANTVWDACHVAILHNIEEAK